MSKHTDKIILYLSTIVSLNSVFCFFTVEKKTNLIPVALILAILALMYATKNLKFKEYPLKYPARQIRDTILIFAVFAFLLVDKLVFRENWVFAVGHFLGLLLLIEIIKFWSTSNIAVIFVISAALLTAAATKTTEMSFFPFFIIFLILTPITFIIHYNQSISVKKQTYFFITSLLLSLLIILVSGFFFTVLPRINVKLPRQYEYLNLSCLSDEVRASDITRIKQRNRLLMRIESQEGQLWRGRAFDYYDGRAWMATARSRISQSHHWSVDGSYIPLIDENITAQIPQERVIRQKVALEYFGGDTIIAAFCPLKIKFPALSVRSNQLDDLLTPQGFPLHPGIEYEVFSAHYDLEDIPLQTSYKFSDFQASQMRRYLQLPNISERVKSKATEIISNKMTYRETVGTILFYLKNSFSYRLDMPDLVKNEITDELIFETKEGHCVYFATAMAVLLRLSGIPCRLVNGFLEGDYDPVGGYYLVSAKDTHAWVEVYFPNYGWIPCDPTSAPIAQPASKGSFWSELVPNMARWRLRWQLYIIGFSHFHQKKILNYLQAAQVELLKDLSQNILKMKKSLKNLSDILESEKTRIFITLICLTAFYISGLFLFKRGYLKKWLKMPIKPRKNKVSRIYFYNKLLKILKRFGIHRDTHITPLELMNHPKIASNNLNEAVQILTEFYYRVRYGDYQLSFEDSKKIKKLLQNLAAHKV